MASREVIEIIYGKHAKFEIAIVPGGFLKPTEYAIYKNGKYYKGTYRSLADAVSKAKAEG